MTKLHDMVDFKIKEGILEGVTRKGREGLCNPCHFQDTFFSFGDRNHEFGIYQTNSITTHLGAF